MKKLISIILTMTLVFILAACSPTNQQPSDSAAPPAADSGTSGNSSAPAVGNTGNAPADTPSGQNYGYKIGGCAIDMSSPLFVALVNASEQAAKDYGCSIVWKSGEGSLEKQISIIENYIEQGMDCILIDPLDAQGMAATVKKAQDAGIKTICMGNYVKADGNVSTVYNDVVDVQACVDLMVHMQGDNSKMAGIFGVQGNYSSDRRQEGFEAGTAKYPNVSKVIGYCSYNAAEGAKTAQDMLAANKDIAGMWIVDDTVAYAVQEVIKTVGLEENILVIALCGMDEAIAKVADGSMFGTNLLGGARLGYYNTALAIRMLRGEQFNEIEYFPCPIVVKQEIIDIVKANNIGPDSTWMTPEEAALIVNDWANEFAIEPIN